MINAAASDALIEVGAGTYDGPLTIDKNLTLAGAGAAQTTITVPRSGGTMITADTGHGLGRHHQRRQRQGRRRPPRPAGATLTVQNSTLAHNSARDIAGGIYNSARATLTLDASLLSGNTGVYGGGAMVNPGSTVALNGTTITGNRRCAPTSAALATTAP